MKTLTISLLLLFTVPTFAQESVDITMEQLDQCTSLSINYALLVLSAHQLKTEQAFNEMVEAQIAKQIDKSEALASGIRTMAAHAWKDRDLSPTSSGMSIYQKCIRALMQPSVPAVKSQST